MATTPKRKSTGYAPYGGVHERLAGWGARTTSPGIGGSGGLFARDPIDEISPPVVETDPYWANVVLLLQPTGADDSIVFVDQSSYAHTVTALANANSGAKQSTEQQINGMNSIECDGFADLVRVPPSTVFDVGDNVDFTLEFMARFNTVSARQIFVGINGPLIAYFDMHRNANSKMVWLQSRGGASIIIEFDQVLVTNTWYHFAVSRVGTITRVFVDGVQCGSYDHISQSGIHVSGGNGFEVGCCPNIGGNSLGLNGFVTQVRYTVGVGRYTVGFTRPSSPFPVG
jgi:hypothetical protein